MENKFENRTYVDDYFKGKWHELKGKVKKQWGKLTDDDITTVEGRMEELSGRLQARYGYERERANREINDWLHHEYPDYKV